MPSTGVPRSAQTTSVHKRPSGRVPWGSINREQIVAAATKAVQAGGYEQMTIRSLAADMGVSPMSLYRHVRDKDDLLDEVVDRLLVRAWKPRAAKQDWKAWIGEAADKFRQFLVAQPAALHVYLHHPVVSPSAVVRMEAMMRVLRDALGNEQTARRAYGALHTYTIGFAALEASRAGWSDRESSGNQLSEQLAAYTTPRQFNDGLRFLLDGIENDAGLTDRR